MSDDNHNSTTRTVYKQRDYGFEGTTPVPIVPPNTDIDTLADEMAEQVSDALTQITGKKQDHRISQAVADRIAPGIIEKLNSAEKRTHALVIARVVAALLMARRLDVSLAGLCFATGLNQGIPHMNSMRESAENLGVTAQHISTLTKRWITELELPDHLYHNAKSSRARQIYRNSRIRRLESDK